MKIIFSRAVLLLGGRLLTASGRVSGKLNLVFPPEPAVTSVETPHFEGQCPALILPTLQAGTCGIVRGLLLLPLPSPSLGACLNRETLNAGGGEFRFAGVR